MGKTVTFSFSSTKYKGTVETETFTFEELGIDEVIDDKVLKKVLNEISKAWVWDKLNISYSIVIEEDKNIL